MGGFVYFNEISEMSNLSIGMFTLGTLISILGIVILSSRAPPVGTRAERYGKLDVTDELDEEGENDDLVGLAGRGKELEADDKEEDDEGDIELRIRARSTSSSSDVIVQRVAGAFVLTMSDSECSSPADSPRGSSPAASASAVGTVGFNVQENTTFSRYTDQEEEDEMDANTV